jgi:ABC-2 type transport system permease protein
MNGTHIRALVRKELLDLSRNIGALLPLGVVALVALVLPFGIAIAVPALTGHALGDDADLVQLSRVASAGTTVSPEARVQLFLFQQFLMLFLLMPVTGGMSLAAHSVVGEKQTRTLEPLLATPISTFELLIAKVLGVLIPTLAISMAGVGLYAVGLALMAAPGVVGAMLNVRTALLLLLVGPALALVSLQAALLISSRANDPRTAQQFSVLIVLPLTGIVAAQFSGLLWLNGQTILWGGLSLLGVWGLLALISTAVFDRESILTRWR